MHGAGAHLSVGLGRGHWRFPRPRREEPAETRKDPPSRAPSDFTGRDGALISDLAPSSFRVDSLGEGDQYYVDRDYTLAVIPAFLDKAEWIRSANDDKTVDADGFVAFEVSRPVTVYLAFDPRASSLTALAARLGGERRAPVRQWRRDGCQRRPKTAHSWRVKIAHPTIG